MRKIRVLIVDDQLLMRDGLKTILSTQQDIEVAGQAENGQDAVFKAAELKPDVILMDIKMPVMNGVEATKKILESSKDIKILILTTFDDDEYVIDALSYGATGYMLKDIDGQKLIQGVRDAFEGNILLPGKIAKKLVDGIGRGQRESIESNDAEIISQLSNRELEIAKLMVEGMDSRQIAKRLFLSQGTVKNYMSNIYTIIGTNDRAKAVILLKNLGL
jgi:DNA-binding NarL/FixJ family response regulator